MLKRIVSCFLWVVWSAALLFPGLSGSATAGDSTGLMPWDKAFLSSPAPAVLAAANAVHAPEKGDIVVLMDEATFSFDAEGRCVSRCRLVYRILTPAGVEEWAAISSGWSPWYQERPSLRARVVSPDGVEHMLSPETISDAPERQGSSNVYSDSRVVQAPLPAIAVGAVVEQEVIIREKIPSFGAGSVHRFYFGSKGRTIRTRVTIESPAALPLLYRVRLLPKLAVSRSTTDGRVRLTFESGPLEAIESVEPGIPGDIQRWPHVAFTAGRSWSEVGTHYGEIVDRRIAGSDISALVRETVGNTTDRDKIVAVLLARLRKDVRYTGIEFGSASIVPRSPEETLKQKYGDCKDQAALLIKMLRTAGVPARMALIRSGFGVDVEPDLPGLGDFNHAIVYVPGASPLWIDPTASFSPAGELPLNDQGRRALIAGGPFPSLVVTPESPSNENRQIEMREFFLAEQGKARVIETSRMWGSIGASYREDYKTSDKEKVRKGLKEYVQNMYLADKLTALETSDPDNVVEPFRIRFEMKEAERGLTDNAEALVALHPSFLTERLPAVLIDDKKDTAPGRTHDYLLPEPYVYEARYHITPPPGFKAHSLPESGSRRFGPMILASEYRVEEDGAVTAVLRFDTGKRRLTPAEFEAAKAALKKLKDEKAIFVRFEQIGWSLRSTGKFTEALAEFRRLVSLHPKEAFHHVQIADTLLEMGLRDAALKEAERAIAIEPDSCPAHRILAWILQHDVFGRHRPTENDRKRALAEYRKAKALDPSDFSTRGNLAILLEYGEDGERYGRHADLAGAIEEYRALRTDLKQADLDVNLLICLYRTGRWKELKELALSLEESDTSTLYLILAIAGEEGAHAALKEARKRIPDVANRRKILETAASRLAFVRYYQAAAELLEDAANGASNAVSLRERSNSLKKVKHFDKIPLPDGELTTVVKRMFLSLFVPESVPDSLISLFACNIREEIEKEGAGAELRDMESIIAEFLREDGDPPREVVADIALSALELRSEGNDATGYRITASNPARLEEPKSRLFVVKEKGRYRIVGGGTKPGVIGLEVLRRVESGDFSGAKTWLDWAREEVPFIWNDDPFAEEPFFQIWGQGAPASPERMRIAAACLLSGMGHDKAITILLKARETAEKELVTAIDVALARAYAGKKMYPELLRLCDRLKKTYSNSPALFTERVHALRMMNRWDEIRSVAEERLGKIPKDPVAIRILAYSAERKGDFDQAEMRYKILVEDGTATAGDYNNLAWLGLFRKTVPSESLPFAERAVAMSGGKNEYALHTLSALYAETGKAAEARETILKALGVSGGKIPLSNHWYVLGRIAEQYGETEAAMEAYRKVAAPKPEENVANSSYVLARKRLVR